MRTALSVLLAALLLLAAAAWWLFESQGADPEELAQLPGSPVVFDGRGVPTIQASDWAEAAELQGYVLASERLFQMDLLRRYAAGRLSEWFGAAAVEADRRRHLEDWVGVADRAYRSMPREEQELVDRYARGVNRFIETHVLRWGLEYLILRTAPEPWTGSDSMLVLLGMCEQLSVSAEREASEARWRALLSPSWGRFLFPSEDPWNLPLIGDGRRGEAPPLPPAEEFLRPASAVPERGSGIEGGVPGSNNWAWCTKEACFVASDPHLGATVPQTWYALRIWLDAERWVAGVSLPGLPGVVIGLNPTLAWAFTNVGEDVDDYLLERISADGSSYLARLEEGREVWLPVEVRRSTIQVRGGEPIPVEARFTHRGPLARRPGLPDGEYSRQWLPFKEGMLRLPTKLNSARSIEEMNAALDAMKAPAQNVVMADRDGRIAYRTSGTGVLRQVSGRLPTPALEGEWLGFESPQSRPRLVLEPDAGSGEPRFLATANERIFVDRFGHPFGDDRRKRRITEVLSSIADGPGVHERALAQMEGLQLDTKSFFHQLLLRWLAERYEPENPEIREMVERWRGWNGVASEDPRTFTEALAAEEGAQEILLGRVREELLPPQDRGLEYKTRLWRAWLLAALPRLGVFGMEERAFVDLLIERVRASTQGAPSYPEQNRWRAQHPFVGRVPVIGEWFRVGEPEQVGSPGLVRVEAPRFGASMRAVFDVLHPEHSTWVFPVGQSGHPRSPHYSDFQEDWGRGARWKVLDERFRWSSATSTRETPIGG